MKENKSKLKNILWGILISLISLFEIVFIVLLLGIYGKTENLLTQFASFLFPTITPFIVIISIIFIGVAALGVYFTDGKWLKRISAVACAMAILSGILSIMPTVRFSGAVHKNGGEYHFFQSLNLSMYWSAEPDEQIVYRETEHGDLTLSVYKNSEGKSNLPVYVYIHGGGWTENHSETASTLHRFFADNGFVAFSVNYTLAKEDLATWEVAIEDCSYAMKWIYDHADEYGGNPDNIVVCGESAGGNLALIYANASAEGLLAQKYGFEVPVPKAACVMYPVIDPVSYYKDGRFFSTVSAGGSLEWYIGGTDEQYPERVEAVSPAAYLTDNVPQTMILVYEKDSLVPIKGAESYAKRAEEIGADVTLYRLPFGNHANEIMCNNMGNQADRTIIMNFLKERGIIE